MYRNLAHRSLGSRVRGFTLVEILIVVVILGIIGAIIVPQMGTRDDLKTASVARALMSDLIYAQSSAITQQVPFWVVFDTTNQTYTIYRDDPTNAAKIDKHPVLHENYIVRLGAGATNGLGDVALDAIKIRCGSLADDQVVIGFDHLGTPVCWKGATDPDAVVLGQITLKCKTYTLRLDIEPYTGAMTLTTL